jgi:hypothetical protein
MGTKELQLGLQDEHECIIGYDTVWKGKEKALAELYDSCQESFQLLYNWRSGVTKVFGRPWLGRQQTTTSNKISH